MTKYIIILIIVISHSFASTFDAVSVGLFTESGGSATFRKNDFIYGLDVQTLYLDYRSEAEYIGQSWIVGPNGEEYLADIYDYDEGTISAIILMPKFGKRSPIYSKGNIHTFFNYQFYLLIPFIDVENNNSDDDFDESEIEVGSESLIDRVGCKLAYELEYKWNDQLSLSTHIGFNYLLNNMDIGGDELQSRLGATYTKFSLNFTF